jgi:hypothetical protein
MMKPFSGTTPSGRTIQIDYVRLGDLASDLLGLNTDLNFYPGEPLGVCSNVQSKHFVIWWSPHTDVLYPSYAPFANQTSRHQTCLRMLEETWQYYEKVLGYPGPFIDTDGSTPGRYKFTITTWHDGGWMSIYHGFPYNNFGPTDMGTDHAFNPIRHEMGHGVQATCTGYLNGRHWESHVGYLHNSCAAYIGPVSDPDMGMTG